MWTTSEILNSANRICSSLGLHQGLSRLDDLDFEFLQNVLGRLIGFRSTATYPEYIITECLRKISEVTEVPIVHIRSVDLLDSDLTAWGNLLEILEFLVNLVGVTEKYDVVEQINLSDESTTSLCSPVKESDLNDVTKRVNELLREFDADKFPVPQREDAEGQTHRDPVSEHCSLDSPDKNTRDAQPAEHNASRLFYLREKLKECLQTGEFACLSTGHLDAASGETCSQLSDSSESTSDNYSETSASVCGSEDGKSSGLVKPQPRPLVRSMNNGRFEHTETPNLQSMLASLLDEPGDLLDKMLAAFPALELDVHDRRILSRKARSCSATSRHNRCPGISPSTRRKLTWVEERDRRRLAQLLRHGIRMSRFRDQKAAEEEDRRMKEQLRERRRQVIRVRKYYQQFVSEFRAKKLAKVFEEEQVFRNFFQELLAQERENLKELQKLEREERHQKRMQKEEHLANLEYTRRARMAFLKEKLEEEEKQRLNSERQKQMELSKRKRELRQLLETNIRELQRTFLENQDSVYFRKKDAERLLEHQKGFVF